MTRLRKVAMTLGPTPVRTLQVSSAEGDITEVVQRLDALVAAACGARQSR
jgi:hypothetical protein